MVYPLNFTLQVVKFTTVKQHLHLDMLPSSDYIIADRGYDSEALREQIRDKNAIPVIPRKKNGMATLFRT